jgi:hypothetical protein
LDQDGATLYWNGKFGGDSTSNTESKAIIKLPTNTELGPSTFQVTSIHPNFSSFDYYCNDPDFFLLPHAKYRVLISHEGHRNEAPTINVVQNFLYVTVYIPATNETVTSTNLSERVQATNSIVTSGIVSTSGFSTVEFVAGGSIKLQDGFKTGSGNVFMARIGTIIEHDEHTEVGVESKTAFNSHVERFREEKSPVQLDFDVLPNNPNPFNPATTIHYTLNKDVRVKLKIYDILGREVRTLVNRAETAGFKSVIWDGRGDKGNQVPSGNYIYRLQAGDFVKSRKMLLIK